MGSNRCIKFMTHMKTGRFTFSCCHNLLFQCHLIEFAGKDCKLESLKESVDKMNDKIKKITDQMMPYKEAAATR